MSFARVTHLKGTSTNLPNYFTLSFVETNKKKSASSAAIQHRDVIYLCKFNLAKRPCTGVVPSSRIRTHIKGVPGGRWNLHSELTHIALNVFSDPNLLAQLQVVCAYIMAIEPEDCDHVV